MSRKIKLLLLAVFAHCGSAQAWDPNKPFIYEMRIAFETDNWINMYSTATVLSKSDNTDAFRVVANSTVTPTYQLVVTTQGNVGIAISSPSYKLDVNGSVNAGAYYVNGTLLSSSGSSQWTTSGSNIYYNSGNVGIGTSAPASFLYVQGNNQSGNYIATIWNTAAGGTASTLLVRGGAHNSVPNFTVQDYSGNTDLVVRGDGNVGIGTIYPGYTLHVNGTAYCTSSWQGSDLRWKKNVAPVSGALDKILKLRGVNFDWRADEFPDMKFSTGPQIGFIAQEVKKVVPEAVSADDNGFLAVSYEQLVPVFAEAMKEQQRQIDSLKSENAAQKAEIARIKSADEKLSLLEKRLSAIEQKQSARKQ